MSGPPRQTIALELDGRSVELADEPISLLEALRDRLGVRAAKDGCSPQGQCGCCTVLVDGAPRVACVTPLRRVAGKSVVTVDGLAAEVRTTWADAFCATGASQCGFCTPGIICRLEAARTRGVGAGDVAAVERALSAHLCRCTGWRPILDAYALAVDAQEHGTPVEVGVGRDMEAAARRATLEGRAPQQVGPEVALGRGGFADDDAPEDALVAVPDGAGGWVVGETLHEARAAAGKVQGRRTSARARPPLSLPDGDWVATLRTCWTEPGYLEPDAAWCAPGGEPVGPLVNGGAFGGKLASPVAAAARTLADRWERPVRVLLAREDVVRLGPKRPPVAGGVRADGSGVLRIVTTPGVAEVIEALAPSLVVEEVAAPGPPTDRHLRGAGWVEALMLLDACRAAAAGEDLVAATGPVEVDLPGGGWARAAFDPDGSLDLAVDAGAPLDEVVLRSYCVGAAHQALSWVRSEGLAVTDGGVVEDLTIRSFGILRAADMPIVRVELRPSEAEPVNGSEAVFAAVALAAWRWAGRPADLPTGAIGSERMSS